MEVLPKDIQEKIANELSPVDFVKFCSEKENGKICNDDNIWRRRLKKDFGFLYPLIPADAESSKDTYLYIFKTIAESCEDITKIFLEIFRETIEYLDVERYKKDLFDTLYKNILEMFERFLDKKK